MKTMINLSDLTLLLPTMNRPIFLNRTLFYYSSIQWNGKILIGDSSRGKDRFDNLEVIQLYQNTLDITYYYLPSYDFPHNGYCLRKLAEFTKTKYCIYSGDDDFLLPSKISECIDFLEHNDDYVACGASRMKFLMGEQAQRNQIVNLISIQLPNYDDHAPIDRLFKYLNTGFSVQYSVHRTHIWNLSHENVHKGQDKYIYQELLPCSISVLLGKHKLLDGNSVFFEINRKQIFSFKEKTTWDWMCDNCWPVSITEYQNCIKACLKDVVFDENSLKLNIQAHFINILFSQFNKKKSLIDQEYPENLEKVQLYKKQNLTSDEISVIYVLENL
jgi:glycosyltransferase domain-containing protein